METSVVRQTLAVLHPAGIIDNKAVELYNYINNVNEYTIVVPDADVLSCVCGTNDNNLKLIENHLGTPVFTRGNELSVDTDDSSVRQEFQYIIDRIVDEINDGSRNTGDIIASVLNIER